jgi:hypothetical protein
MSEEPMIFVCECSGEKCLLHVTLLPQDYREHAARGLCLICDGCEHGPETDEVLIEKGETHGWYGPEGLELQDEDEQTCHTGEGKNGRLVAGVGEGAMAGEMSAHAAMVTAGFRQVPTPLDLLRRAWSKASKREKDEFVEWIGKEGW